jgi:vesicular inhibitory amino acid transporter
VKICIGTGTLALPYAISEGGFLTGTFGFILIALWNYYASVRLDNLRDWTGMKSYALIAGAVLGSNARIIVNVSTISTLIGVCVVYTITFATLFHETPLTLFALDRAIWGECILCGLFSIPLVCAPHLKFLAGSSAIGLVALAVGFSAIFVYGFSEFEGVTCASPSLWGSSLSHFAAWFGVAAFCFGIPPIQLSISEAMSDPTQFTSILGYALSIVVVFYLVCGVGSAWLFRCSSISENILTNLPEDSIFASILRLACCAVTLTSIPLCLVPAADMLTSVLHIPTTVSRYPLRIGLVVLITVTAILLPDFGLMVAIIGNFSVALLSFVLPSAMAVACAHRDYPPMAPQTNQFSSKLYYVDILLLVAGVLTCIFTTSLTLLTAFASSNQVPLST